jgi:transposase
VKRERLDFLADNSHFTKRFAFYVGRRCRQASIRDVAKELKLDWDTVKTLEKQYMRAQLERAGTPGPRAIGIDEISVRKGHSYRIVVSDLVRKRPIWFGGEDRSEASMAAFYNWLGLKKSRKIKLAVMDMWKPFRNVTKDKAPQAAILFDKFHIMRHLGEASVHSRFCSPPTGVSTPPTSSRRPSASSGTTGARAGRAASSTTGEPASNGSASDPTSASPT